MKTNSLRYFLYLFIPSFLYTALVDLNILPSFDILILLIIFLSIIIGYLLKNFAIDLFIHKKVKYNIYILINIFLFLIIISIPLLDERKIIDFHFNLSSMLIMGIFGFYIKWSLSIIFRKEVYNKIVKKNDK